MLEALLKITLFSNTSIICPRSLCLLYKVTSYMKWVKISWAYSNIVLRKVTIGPEPCIPLIYHTCHNWFRARVHYNNSWTNRILHFLKMYFIISWNFLYKFVIISRIFWFFPPDLYSVLLPLIMYSVLPLIMYNVLLPLIMYSVLPLIYIVYCFPWLCIMYCPWFI